MKQIQLNWANRRVDHMPRARPSLDYDHEDTLANGRQAGLRCPQIIKRGGVVGLSALQRLDGAISPVSGAGDSKEGAIRALQNSGPPRKGGEKEGASPGSRSSAGKATGATGAARHVDGTVCVVGDKGC